MESRPLFGACSEGEDTVRVEDLAEELGVSPNQVVTKSGELGFEVSTVSMLGEDLIEELRKAFQEGLSVRLGRFLRS